MFFIVITTAAAEIIDNYLANTDFMIASRVVDNNVQLKPLWRPEIRKNGFRTNIALIFVPTLAR